MKNSSPGTNAFSSPWRVYGLHSLLNAVHPEQSSFTGLIFLSMKRNHAHVFPSLLLPIHIHPHGGGRVGYKRVRERSPVQCSANLTMRLTLRSQWQCSKGRDCNSQNTDIFNDFNFLCFHVPFAAFSYLSLIPEVGFVVLLLAIEFISLASFALTVFFQHQNSILFQPFWLCFCAWLSRVFPPYHMGFNKTDFQH